jgi:hypothetical protein
VKRLCADDSAATSVKVGYRQASYTQLPAHYRLSGLFAFGLQAEAATKFHHKQKLQQQHINTRSLVTR